MKVALLTIGGVDRSGTDRVIPCLLSLIERLTVAGHEVHVFVPMQEVNYGTWPLLGATVHNAGKGFWRLRMLASIGREQRKARFDVLHAFWANMGSIGGLASKLLRVPMLLTLPGGDVVRIPEIGYGGRLSARGRMGLRLATRAAAASTVPSNFMRTLARNVGIDTITVPLGVDTARSPPIPPRLRDILQPLKLVHVASLNRVKDQPTLLKALQIVKSRGVSFELRIIGVDTLDGEIRRLASQLELDAEIGFLGPIGHDKLRDHYAWADLLVMSSRHEAGPLVMLEAALAGIPTVGTRVGHLADQCPDAALACPIGDPDALAGAIIELANDDARRIRVAKSAQTFSLNHDAGFTARTFMSMYQRISGKP